MGWRKRRVASYLFAQPCHLRQHLSGEEGADLAIEGQVARADEQDGRGRYQGQVHKSRQKKKRGDDNAAQ